VTLLFWTVVAAVIAMTLVGFPRRGAPIVVAAITIVFILLGGIAAAHAPPREPTRQEAKRWARNWCAVRPGFSRAHTIKLMGRPTRTGTDQLEWTGFGYALYAFLDEDWRVRQLDINDIAMSRRQRAKLTCETTREA
jgi:hypothetical protein